MTPDEIARLTPEQQNFILRLYEDFHDDTKFARESLKINTKAGSTVALDYGPAQKKLAAVVARQKELGLPVRVIVLKARQVWISTYIASRLWRDTAFVPGQHSLVLAQDEDTASNIFKYYQTFDDSYVPFRDYFAKPERKGKSEQILEYTNGSYIKFHTAMTATVGRSRSLRRVHFSEFAFYTKAREIFKAVMSGVPDDNDTEVFVESTANGLGNEFHSMWQRAVSGESEWVAFFFAWWEHPEYVRALSMSAAMFEVSLTEYEKDLRQQYRLTHEQLNWRRWKIANDLNGDEEGFKQEFPSCAEEAFLASGRPRFDHKSLARMPIIDDAIEGGLEMLELSVNQKRITFVPRQRGELVIYRKPSEQKEYVVGGDVAEGIDAADGFGKADPDYCFAQVLDRDTGEQVARMRARFTPGEFGRQLYLLGLYFYWAQIVVEANGVGLATVDSLINLHYPKNLLYHRFESAGGDPEVRADLIGYKTTPVTRPQLISGVDEGLRSMAVILHDPVTKSECLTFVIKPNGRAEAQKQCHDDGVISLGLAIVGIQQMPRRAKTPILPGAERRGVENYRKNRDGDSSDSSLRGQRLKLL